MTTNLLTQVRPKSHLPARLAALWKEANGEPTVLLSGSNLVPTLVSDPHPTPLPHLTILCWERLSSSQLYHLIKYPNACKKLLNQQGQRYS